MRAARGLDRLIAFADAVVAIAITLLILPLVDIASSANGEPLSRLLREHSDQLFAFGLSFVVIARLWLSHHQMFDSVEENDNVIIGATLVWLLTVVFLPFPTALLGQGSPSGGNAVLYIGTLLASLACLALLDERTRRIREDHDRAAGRSAARARAWPWTPTILTAVALVLVIAIPRATMWPLLLLLLGAPIDRLLVARSRRRHPAGS